MACLKMFPAKDGDAFLFKENDPINAAILVDGGYISTFNELIKPELEKMHASGESLELVVATHIDADHISGLLELFRLNQSAHTPRIINIKNVWHNSLRSLPLEKEEGVLSKQDHELLAEICSLGFPSPVNNSLSPEEISARQGSSLAALLLRGGYRWNNEDGHTSINYEATQTFQLTSHIAIHVLGPPIKRLQSLRRQWFAELRRIGWTGKVAHNEAFDDAYEFLCAMDDALARINLEEISHRATINVPLADAYIPDESLNNASSIAFILETRTSRILFLGDAWANDVINSLSGLRDETQPLLLDAVKISHHGSLRNTNIELLGMIDAPIYLISTNGDRHGHPDLPVLKAIVDRPANFVRHLHFNYSTPASRLLKTYIAQAKSPFVVHECNTDWITIGKMNQ